MAKLLGIGLTLVVFLGGVLFNRTQPFILGVPTFFAWTLFSVLLMSGVLGLIYSIDPVNRQQNEEVSQ